jgi:hypothetical protein
VSKCHQDGAVEFVARLSRTCSCTTGAPDAVKLRIEGQAWTRWTPTKQNQSSYMKNLMNIIDDVSIPELPKKPPTGGIKPPWPSDLFRPKARLESGKVGR